MGEVICALQSCGTVAARASAGVELESLKMLFG